MYADLKLSPTLSIVVTIYSFSGIYFGDFRKFLIKLQSNQSLICFKWIHSRSTITIAVHLALIGNAIYQLAILYWDGMSMIARRSLNDPNSMHKLISSFKPISRFALEHYSLMFALDNLVSYGFILINGRQYLRLLNSICQLSTLVDNENNGRRSKAIGPRSPKTARLVGCSMLSTVVFFQYLYSLDIFSDRSRLSTGRTIVYVTFRWFIINHRMLPYVLIYCAFGTSIRILTNLTRMVQQETNQSKLADYPLVVDRLSFQLDLLYSLVSFPMLVNHLFMLIALIFDIMYCVFKEPDHSSFYRRLLVDLLFAVVFGTVLYRLGNNLIDRFDQFYHQLNQQYSRRLVDLSCTNDIQATTRRINQFLLKRSNRCQIVPRLFHIFTIQFSVWLEIVLYSVNFAISLYQTENL